MNNIIGIRREDLSKRGEKRVAITPELAHHITREGHRLILQSATHPKSGTLKRAFADQHYAEAGAEVSENLGPARVIFGLKEIEKDKIMADKTYLFFSHTHKGQEKNRAMLKTLVEKRATVIDYELITNSNEQRLITAFTYFAGYAGMIDTLWTYAKRLAGQGIHHPFQAIPQSIEKEDLGLIKGLVKKAGKKIKAEGTPSNLPPMITTILGTGKTSIGAQEIYDLLPVKEIGIDDAEEFFTNGRRDQVYKIVLDIHQIFRLKPDASLHPATYQAMSVREKWNHYFNEPGDFESNLDKVLPYTSILMNCILWAPEYPRHLDNELMARMWAEDPALQAIGDISCDPQGSIEFSKETWIDNPVYIYNPVTGKSTDGFDGRGIAVMAVTNLPCGFSADASIQFSHDLAPVLDNILQADYENSFENSGLCDEASRATILWQGKFTPRFEYMADFIRE